ncbi:MAG: hypothetical protein Q8Q94_03210 [bacterium]|nr:hypothetical protein [bacterium]MDZ4299603.1 hypothetical protein [Candidatus Sungbacteria bacterium]
MEENLQKKLENELETSLKNYSEGAFPQVERMHKLLDQEYEKEIDDQINFLRNITVMAGVVAPFSLTLLSDQSLGVQKPFLLIGFILLLSTVLVTLLSSKKFLLNRKYKDTPNLARNHIIARCSVDDLLNINKSLSDRVISLNEVQKSIDTVYHKFSNLGYTNKLTDLRNRLSASNRWSIFLFSFGLISIMMSVVYTYSVIFFDSFISLIINS